ncbi:MAG: tol-pal system protein YbgF [Gammaproteobacteria bacterium]|nr:tol-pal system protein YbgF [Gammaproteobacteria bacterium]
MTRHSILIGGSVLRTAATLALAASVAACSLTPEKGPDPRDLKIAELESRVQQLEGVLKGEGLAELNRQVAQLQAEQRRLVGSLEEQQFALEGSRKQARDQYTDLDARVQRIEQAAAAVPSPAAVEPDEAEYQAAFELIKAGRYDEAQKALQAFLAAHPASALSDSATYWLGEVHYVKKAWWPAHTAFNKVATTPGAAKAADALLKRGYVEYELKRYESARKTWQDVVKRYPGTPVAADAAERLKKLKAEGR